METFSLPRERGRKRDYDSTGIHNKDPTTDDGRAKRACNLDPKDFTVVLIAPLEIEARAALHLLDERYRERFPVGRGDDYVYHAGKMCGHNIIVATLPAGQECSVGSTAALASQVKKLFSTLWFGLLVGVASGLPDLSRPSPRDIRLGDVLVGLPDGDTAGLIAYDLGKETKDGFQPLRSGHVLATTETIVRAAIGSIRLEAPYDSNMILPYYESIRDKEHAAGTFADPGQDRDLFYLVQADGTEILAERARRPGPRRTRVWYGPIGSGEKLMRNARKRDELRDRYGVIGLDTATAGVMNRIPVGVIRGVCDYGDKHANGNWQPYAAAMAAAYAKAILDQISPAREVNHAGARAIPQGFSSGALGDVRVSRPGQSDDIFQQPRYYDQSPGAAIEYFERVCQWRRENLLETAYSRLASEYVLSRAYLKDKQSQKAVNLLEQLVAEVNGLLAEDDPY